MKQTFTLVAIAAILSMSLICSAENQYQQDVVKAADGSDITLTFYTHASIAVNWNGFQIYVDPVGKGIEWESQPKADLVLITHTHGDHLDVPTVKILNGTGDYVQLKPGETLEPVDGLKVEAVPAYNISEGHTNFHPKERGDAGYIINAGGSRIYVAGDTEDNEDVLALKDIDIAFLPVNQPYTMTVDQCVRVVEAIRPSILYPYHFGNGGKSTDLKPLIDRVSSFVDVRVRNLE